MPTIGTRYQVWKGTAKKTSGNLTKSGLTINKSGSIVSKKASARAKSKSNLKGFLVRKRSTRKKIRKPRYGES